MNGQLIVIDGIDGSGKATQTKLLGERLRNAGHHVETMNFPQYEHTFFGKMVRRYLNGEFGNPTEVNPYLASLLYALDRFESAGKLVQWLREGKTVVLDRYYTSNLIHQGAKMEEAALEQYQQWLDAAEFEVLKIPKPDVVIFLHVDARTSLKLISQRGLGRDGHDTLEHLQTAEKRCVYLAQKLGWKTIECCREGRIRSLDEIHEEVWNALGY
ncbi:deoxynucleoside kinase [Candidatus Woesearchaeota archaeon]|nr:deoxynucleoside kinase [Candidatus Woesearchaeota archaeon]